MPKLSLRPHLDTRSPVEAIAVDVTCDASGLLRLGYEITGAINRVAIPQPEPASRTDALWKHTCFEAFLGADAGYYEFNLSPSSQWAAYRFDGYRAGMRNADIPEPRIMWRAKGGTGRLAATIQLPVDVSGTFGLSAVIEGMDGARSFWALAHPSAQPDFHHPACFTAQLPPAS